MRFHPELEILDDTELARRANARPTTFRTLLALGVLLDRFREGGRYHDLVAKFLTSYRSAKGALPWVDRDDVWAFILRASLKGILKFDPERKGKTTGRPASLTTFLRECYWRHLGDELKRIAREESGPGRNAHNGHAISTVPVGGYARPNCRFAYAEENARHNEAVAQILDNAQTLKLALPLRVPLTPRHGERDRDIVRACAIEARTHVEVAGEYGLSEKQVGRIVKTAMDRERKFVERADGARGLVTFALATSDPATLARFALPEQAPRRRGQSRTDVERGAAEEDATELEQAKTASAPGSPRLATIAASLDAMTAALDGERVRIPGGWAWRKATAAKVTPEGKVLKVPTADEVLAAEALATVKMNRAGRAAGGWRGRDGRVAQDEAGKELMKEWAQQSR